LIATTLIQQHLKDIKEKLLYIQQKLKKREMVEDEVTQIEANILLKTPKLTLAMTKRLQ